MMDGMMGDVLLLSRRERKRREGSRARLEIRIKGVLSSKARRPKRNERGSEQRRRRGRASEWIPRYRQAQLDDNRKANARAREGRRGFWRRVKLYEDRPRVGNSGGAGRGERKSEGEAIDERVASSECGGGNEGGRERREKMRLSMMMSDVEEEGRGWMSEEKTLFSQPVSYGLFSRPWSPSRGRAREGHRCG
jgi:hypothetical protein